MMIGVNSVALAANTYEPNENFGKIKLLYADASQGYYFSLTGGKTAMNPKRGYYYVPQTHKNKSVIVDLILRAAERGWTIKVRTQKALDKNGYAPVEYILVEMK